MIAGGETGFLVPVGDPAALASALKRLADSPELRRAMGEAGLRRVQAHFTLRAMTDKIEALYFGETQHLRSSATSYVRS